MVTTAFLKKIKFDLTLHREMINQKKEIKNSLKKMGVIITSMTKLDLSENGGFFFKIFSTGNSYDQMCEFHENDFKQILLIFYSFRPSSGKYEPTGEVMNFQNFEKLKESINLISEKLK